VRREEASSARLVLARFNLKTKRHPADCKWRYWGGVFHHGGHGEEGFEFTFKPKVNRALDYFD
jgi:hypothetical protein